MRHTPPVLRNSFERSKTGILILDPNGVAAQTGDLSLVDASSHDAAASGEEDEDDRVAMLIFRAGNMSSKAVPLALVARLEEIDRSKIEWSGNRALVQYRNQLMPLIPIAEGREMKKDGMQPVIVFSDRERSMGLIVDEIVDIVEDRLNVELDSLQEGFLGSAIINGEATDIIDTGHYLTLAFDDWFGNANAEGYEKGASRKRSVLLVDDSAFFRNLIAPMLSVEGFEVTSVDSAESAMHLCEKGREFDIIVSDIEMPGKNGFEFAQLVRAGSSWSDVPMVAVSAHTAPKDLDRGREVGFNDYVAKFDRAALIQTLHHTLSM